VKFQYDINIIHYILLRSFSFMKVHDKVISFMLVDSCVSHIGLKGSMPLIVKC
jgi:hypothetical protein